jgi:hypothetical protein
MLTPVHATTPLLVTGVVGRTGPFVVLEQRTADGNTFLTETAPVAFYVGIQGQGVEVGTVRFVGSFATTTSEGTFTGTVGGSESGTAEFSGTQGGIGVAIGAGNSCFEEQAVIGNGTAGLTALHGEGTFHICDGQIVTYSLAVHFDPS